MSCTSIFCLQVLLKHGSLAVAGGREIVPAINSLLSMPFALKIATRDFHPQDHVSFDSTHDPPNNKAFESLTTITNPKDNNQSMKIQLWPAHCVQGTPGAEILPEIDISRIDKTIDKGRDKRTEMFSAFADVFWCKTDAASFDLAALIREKEIQHVFVVGLAGDYCVKHTAIDAKKEEFDVYVVEEAVESIDPGEKGWGATKAQFEAEGIKVVSINGPEVRQIKTLTK